MYKITLKNYDKPEKDIFLVKDIQTIRDNTGLSIKIIDQNNDEYFLTKNYKGQYNPYKNIVVMNEVTCTDEIKKKFNYKTNSISSLEIEYIGG